MTIPMPDQEPQPHSELASFGEELRREREIRGISLKEIADATKISKRFLEAIERNDHRTLAGPRLHARFRPRIRALPRPQRAEEMVNRYNFAAAGDDRIEKSAHLERLVHPPVIEREPPQKKGIPPAYARIDRNVYLLVIIVAALLGVAWWALQHKRAELDLARGEDAAWSCDGACAPRVQPRPSPPPWRGLAPPKADEPLRLTLELTDDSWIDLEVDGKTVMKDEYRRGTRDSFEAKDSFRFKRIGNAAAVILMLNDRQLPPLGDDGQVIKNRVFDRAFVEKLNATPEKPMSSAPPQSELGAHRRSSRRSQAGAYPREVMITVARGFLPLPQDDLIAVLSYLSQLPDDEIAGLARTSLNDIPARALHAFASNETASPEYLTLLARASGDAHVLEALIRNRAVPDHAIVELAARAEPGVQEIIVINQARILRAPGILDALLENPNVTQDTRRRALETREEFFEKKARLDQLKALLGEADAIDESLPDDAIADLLEQARKEPAEAPLTDDRRDHGRRPRGREEEIAVGDRQPDDRSRRRCSSRSKATRACAWSSSVSAIG